MPRKTSALVRKLSAPISSLGPKRPQFLGESFRSSLKCMGLVAAIVLLLAIRSIDRFHYRVAPFDANPRTNWGTVLIRPPASQFEGRGVLLRYGTMLTAISQSASKTTPVSVQAESHRTER